MATVPDEGEIGDVVALEKTYLERWADVPAGKGFTELGRQILHCTFGSVLSDPELGKLVVDLLIAHPDIYTEILAEHFERHLQALAAGF